MSLNARFHAALLAPSAAPPEGLLAPGGRPAGRRFDVYRNNVAVSLTEALEAGFPVLRRLVGEAFFKAMAGVFLRSHPPASPVLSDYGADLPAFIERFEPASGLPYLADVARLELALRRAYHAADAAPMAPERLQSLSPDALMAARLGLAPAVVVLRSRFPVHAIWAANAGTGDGQVRSGAAQCVLVTRPGFDPRADAITPAEAAFVEAIADGQAFGAALDRAGDALDLAPLLGRLFAGEALITLEEGPAP